MPPLAPQAAFPLSVAYTNIRSLLHKRDTFYSFLVDSDSDIVVLTETWLNPDIGDNETLPHNDLYKIYRNDHINRRGGGVLLAIKKMLHSHFTDSKSSLKIVWAALSMSSSVVLIGACYRAPDSDHSFLKDPRDSFSHVIQLCPSNHVYLLGDFNFRLIDWEHMSSSCHESLELINLTLDFNVFQVGKEPTRASNILDLVFTNAPYTILSISNVSGFSDHNLLQLNLSIPKPVYGKTTKRIRDYNRGNYAAINIEREQFFLKCYYVHSVVGP